MKREDFLEAFFGALGHKQIIINSVLPERIDGVVLYEGDDHQDFCWTISEDKVPSEAAYLLLKLLQEQDLLETDRIIVTRDELQRRYDDRWGKKTTAEEFAKVIEEIEVIEVPMIDDGKETDAFFIHE